MSVGSKFRKNARSAHAFDVVVVGGGMAGALPAACRLPWWNVFRGPGISLVAGFTQVSAGHASENLAGCATWGV